jgi:hypothetical protein
MAGSKRPSQNHAEGNKKAKKKFRINAMKFWITWSALGDNEVTKEEVLEYFQSKCKVTEYSIGYEKHKNPEDPAFPMHIHAYVVSDRKINIKSCQYFDIKTQKGRTIHPKFESVGAKKEDRVRVIKYSMKDGDYTQELSEPLETKSWAQNLAEAKSVKDGMASLLIDAPDK